MKMVAMLTSLQVMAGVDSSHSSNHLLTLLPCFQKKLDVILYYNNETIRGSSCHVITSSLI